VCLALADLKSGTLVSKGFAKADPKGVDPTPISFFRDSPVWTSDPATDAYIKSCQGTKTGDPIKPLYVERIQSAAMLSDAIKSYDAGNYKKAHELYSKASSTTGGDQLRVYNGLYLTALRLKKMKEAEEAFGKLVDFGIKNNNLAVKFLFKVDSTEFYPDRNVTHPYEMWVRQIGQQAAKDSTCLDLVGHASPTGGEAYNDQLSSRRAETIKSMLVKTSSSLSSKLATKGMGFKENLIGTGRDDASDALDRRVEFKVGKCS
jgi:outer membrane protein OmpA-like peptidoglycan-associated protein